MRSGLEDADRAGQRPKAFGKVAGNNVSRFPGIIFSIAVEDHRSAITTSQQFVAQTAFIRSDDVVVR